MGEKRASSAGAIAGIFFWGLLVAASAWVTFSGEFVGEESRGGIPVLLLSPICLIVAMVMVVRSVLVLVAGRKVS